ncbi:MAG TPA: hypothetical protein VHE34_25740 [Puia sp.]|uniref:hypothetical protein n=1 Tax=Puia sp. TaxID=2045100 RepID=UPI002B5884B7|nr:hypothetical protein [Puia sp.]HVU98661.1 hypothetical protein [Puia sp.]
MSYAKVHLSPEEMRLVTDPGVILTKNSVMAKVIEMFGGLSGEYQKIWKEEGVEPKISRGENYRGLPWVMLDYPRYFGKEEVFAIRTLFWWGHAFSVTLHLKGGYRDRFLPMVQGRWAELAAAGFHMGVSDDEWRHEHVPENYREVSGGVDLVRDDVDFLKLSSAVGLHRWEDAPAELLSMFKTLIGVLF